MSIETSRTTQIEVRGSRMYHQRKEIVTVPLKDALLGFKTFIEDCNCPLLVGHNIFARFDIDILYNSCKHLAFHLMLVVKGSVDTLNDVCKLYKREKMCLT